MIRIVGGTYKHRLLNQPPLEITRATKDVAKEGLFNSLGDIKGLSFLDLFCGSGSIGIEAYSRGAKPVYLNDNNPEVKRVVMRNLISLGVFDCNVYGLKDKDCLKELVNKELTFDIIFLDPPYKMIIDNKYLNNLYELNLANQTTRIVLETDYTLKEEDYSDFTIKVLKYGKSLMNILRRK